MALGYYSQAIKEFIMVYTDDAAMFFKNCVSFYKYICSKVLKSLKGVDCKIQKGKEFPIIKKKSSKNFYYKRIYRYDFDSKLWFWIFY